LIGEQLLSLVQRPGKRLPEDSAALNLVEEAIYHAQQAGRAKEAMALYRNVLGGVRHLGWKLGEAARGRRILRTFTPCPERWDLAWYLRALGEFEEAYAMTSLADLRADIRLLQGRLPLVAREGDSARTAVAAFLMGQTREVPPELLSSTAWRLQVLLYLGRYSQARQSGRLERFFGEVGCQGEQARCQLLLAEVERLRREIWLCCEHLEAASGWVVHSGCVEHLCLFHLVRSRLALGKNEGETGQRAVDEGLHLARQCGLDLYLIPLLCVQAEICLARLDPAAAEHVAAAAWERALAPGCQFLWGAAEAGHLLGKAMLLQKLTDRARPVIERTIQLRRQIGDPRIEASETLLRQAAG
jgi:hypothetical protein